MVILDRHKNMDRGYIRVNKDAGEDEQRQRLLAFGVAPEHIYVDDATKSSYRGIDDLKAREAIQTC